MRKIVNVQNNIAISEYTNEYDNCVYDLVDRVSEETLCVADAIAAAYIEPSANPTFKAIAQCDPLDQYDAKVGKKVAELKCDKKYHKHREKQYRFMIKILKKAVAELETMAEIHEIKLQRIEEKLSKYNG